MQRFLPTLIIFTFSVLLVACSGSVAEPTVAPTPTIAAASGEVAAQVIMEAMRAQLSGPPYRMISKQESNGSVTDFTAEVAPPDRMHTVTLINGVPNEMILIGDRIWTRNGDAPWAEMAGGETASAILRGLSPDTAFSNMQISDAEFLRIETVQGQSARVYSYTTVFSTGASAIRAENILWISDSSGKPIQLVIDTEVNGILTHSEQTFEYDESITVEPPVP